MPGCRGSWVLEVDRSREGWLDTAGEGFKPPDVKGKRTGVGGAARAKPGRGFSGAPGGGADSGRRWAGRPLWAELSGAPRTSPPLPRASPAARAPGVRPTSRSVPKASAASAPSSEREEPRELSAWDATHRPGRKEHPGELGEMQVPGLLQFRGRRL